MAYPKRYIGKKGRADVKNRRELKKEFSERGIVTREHCGTDNGLTFAHALKRKDIHNEFDMKEVALLCLPRHMEIEQLPPPEMARIVRGYIAKRTEIFYEAA